MRIAAIMSIPFLRAGEVSADVEAVSGDSVRSAVASVVRGLPLTSKAAIRITTARAEEMLDDFTDLPLARYPMHPHLRRVVALRNNFTAYDAFYVALAESLHVPLLTDDRKYERAVGHNAVIETWPWP